MADHVLNFFKGS